MNVFCMGLFGVRVIFVESGLRILKDVINEVFCDWVVIFEYFYYLIGLVVGFYLYLVIVRDF